MKLSIIVIFLATVVIFIIHPTEVQFLCMGVALLQVISMTLNKLTVRLGMNEKCVSMVQLALMIASVLMLGKAIALMFFLPG